MKKIDADQVFERYKRLIYQAQTEVGPDDKEGQFLKDVAYRKWTEVNQSLLRGIGENPLLVGPLSLLNKKLDGFSDKQNAKFHGVNRRTVERGLNRISIELNTCMDNAGW